MSEQPTKAEIETLQKWADDMYFAAMYCLDNLEHGEDCHIHRVPDDPDGELGCDCWRKHIRAVPQRYMAKPS